VNNDLDGSIEAQPPGCGEQRSDLGLMQGTRRRGRSNHSGVPEYHCTVVCEYESDVIEHVDT
jgi:hypothetical protein